MKKNNKTKKKAGIDVAPSADNGDKIDIKDVALLKSDKSIRDMTQYEIQAMINRLTWASENLGLVPVIEEIKIRYTPKETLDTVV